MYYNYLILFEWIQERKILSDICALRVLLLIFNNRNLFDKRASNEGYKKLLKTKLILE